MMGGPLLQSKHFFFSLATWQHTRLHQYSLLCRRDPIKFSFYHYITGPYQKQNEFLIFIDLCDM